MKNPQRSRNEVPYEIGTMIELPHACLRAGEIAELADFFSFGHLHARRHSSTCKE